MLKTECLGTYPRGARLYACTSRIGRTHRSPPASVRRWRMSASRCASRHACPPPHRIVARATDREAQVLEMRCRPRRCLITMVSER
jgi:hypothetical protein